MIAISIIMPLYNAEKYLRECIACLLNQTFQGFELICINDCSTDSTGSILQDFLQEDARIKLINNDRQRGAAVSRNIGMRAAKGNYLIFLDGDDIFDEDLLSAAYHKIEQYRADIVMFDYKHVASEDIYNKKRMQHGERYMERYSRQIFSVREQNPYEFLNWHSAACNKLYRKTFIENNQLEFQDLKSSNDVYFSYMALLLSDRTIVLDDERIMVYARDHMGEARISNNRNPICGFMAIEKVQQELMARDKLKDVFEPFFYQFYYFIKALLYTCRGTEKEKELYDYLQKEGVKKICDLGLPYYNQLDEYIRQRLEGFYVNPYETRWYEADNLLDIYLEENKELVCKLLMDYQSKGKEVNIWGAGRNGQSLVEFCKKNHIEVSMIVDVDDNKQGKKIGDYYVSSPRLLGKGTGLIVVSGIGILESVQRVLSQMHTTYDVVDINMLLGII